jgi:hypothetical protein
MKAKKASRRQVLFGAGAAVMAHAQGALSAGTNGWSPITPGDAGFAPAGNYGKEDQGIPPARILREVVLESVR